MRRLSIRQKMVIKTYYDKNRNISFEHLTSEDNKAYADLINNLEKINDYETLWSDTERLLFDLMMCDNLDIKNWG